jgi:hypothetical protein
MGPIGEDTTRLSDFPPTEAKYGLGSIESKIDYHEEAIKHKEGH